MKVISSEELEAILYLHQQWLRNTDKGKQANLIGEHLEGARLEKAHLEGAHLEKAYLRGAHLEGAYLEATHLEGAHLERAHLERAHLDLAHLEGAYLQDAHLEGAYLQDAHLEGAYLLDAHLEGAILRGAHLDGAHLPHFSIVPDEGDFIGWKRLAYNTICKIEIPAGAKRMSSLVGRKCRAEFVRVLEGEGRGLMGGTLYIPGKIVRADWFDDDIRVECSHGIHFFVTRREAEEF